MIIIQVLRPYNLSWIFISITINHIAEGLYVLKDHFPNYSFLPVIYFRHLHQNLAS